MKRVVITGMGALSGEIKPTSVFDASALITDKFGEIDGLDNNNRLYDIIRRTVSDMLADAGLTSSDISAYGNDCRMFFGTLFARDNAYLEHSRTGADTLAMSNEFAVYAAGLAGVCGTIDISSASCAAGTTAIGMAFDFIRNGLCRCAVAGGAEELTPMGGFGFNALKALSGGICNPYDVKHDGINIGEGGAFFMLETLESAQARNARIYCEILGFASGNDAYHPTSPEPTGEEAFHLMQNALDDAGITAERIDYINGHGTGTVLNDSMETNALKRLYDGADRKPFVSSTKALVGHCMGASGAVELASVIRSMQDGKPIVMPRLTEPLDGCELYNAPEHIDIEYAMSNSFGFAGNSASIVLRKLVSE
ncbi:MAG: beta-ketoacyl-[acyl-carrier-protein] synthase family protein [Ruminiclostridium sp.]|nr:beta-ketoacyl-[acyl-carrier-protein] synthase family protein [Ruminiclostridium sp.]